MENKDFKTRQCIILKCKHFNETTQDADELQYQCKYWYDAIKKAFELGQMGNTFELSITPLSYTNNGSTQWTDMDISMAIAAIELGLNWVVRTECDEVYMFPDKPHRTEWGDWETDDSPYPLEVEKECFESVRWGSSPTRLLDIAKFGMQLESRD